MNLELLINGAKSLGITLDQSAVTRLTLYKEELLRVNEYMNLTSITDEDEIIVKHFLDSMTLLAHYQINQNAKVIDVGCGAGFPGLVLKIVRPDLNLTLFDSLKKRLAFLDELIEKMELDQAVTIHARAEDGGHMINLREQFDVAVSRAVAGLNVLCEYCLPFVKENGVFVAYKSDGKKELKNAENSISVLGGTPYLVKNFQLPMSEFDRMLIFVRKIRQTPVKYPRKPADILKKPL